MVLQEVLPSAPLDHHESVVLPEAEALADLDLGFVHDQSSDNNMPLQSAPVNLRAPDRPITRSRARKPATPLVTSQVRRSPRFLNNGYMHTAISETISSFKMSKSSYGVGK